MISDRSLAEVCKGYAAAEAVLKRYERISLQNQTAAVNELRYAGHHLLAASEATEEAEAADHLTRAKRHCERALYDAREAAVVTLLDFFEDIASRHYAADELTHVLPEWQSYVNEIVDVQRRLRDSGMAKEIVEGSIEDADILRLLDMRDAFLKVLPQLDAARYAEAKERSECERKAAEEERQQAENISALRRKTEDRRFVLSMVLAALGTLLSALGLVAMFL